jgi:hypothetical protein
MSWIPDPHVPVIQLPLPTDGIIHVNTEDASGGFTGRHRSGINGQCEVTTKHHIMFTEVIGNTTYIYNGDIVLEDGFLVARGFRSKLFVEGGRLQRLDDDEWIAVKTT